MSACAERASKYVLCLGLHLPFQSLKAALQWCMTFLEGVEPLIMQSCCDTVVHMAASSVTAGEHWCMPCKVCIPSHDLVRV